MMNRNYNLDVNEDDLDNELEELDNEMFQEMLHNKNSKTQPQYMQDANKQVNMQ